MDEEKARRQEFSAQASYRETQGEAKLFIDPDALVIDSVFQREELYYAEISSIKSDGFTVSAETPTGAAVFSRMGSEADWFYRALKNAFDARIKRALLVEGSPSLTARGLVDGREADIEVYPDCVCALSPDAEGARLPIRLISGMKREGWALTLAIGGEGYAFSMLGRELEPLERAIAAAARARSDKNAELVKKLGGGRLRLVEGIAAPLGGYGELRAILEAKIKNSKLGKSWRELCSLCRAEDMAVAVSELPPERFEALKQAELQRLNEGLGEGQEAVSELTPEQEDALRWVLWAAGPTPDGRAAIVEFAIPDEDSATYVFAAMGGWTQTLAVINRALEATGLQREVFSLEKARLGEDAEIMLRRTPAVRKLRESFLGRAAHTGSWRSSVEKCVFRARAEAAPVTERKSRFCSNCGAETGTNVRFCGKCGAKQQE